MTNMGRLSRRERQIMEIIYSLGQASVHQICDQLEGKPTPMAVRRMLAILTEKGHLKRTKAGREHLYAAKQSKSRAGVTALRQVVETFFEGSIGSALATHLERPDTKLSQDDIERLGQLIDELRHKETVDE